MKNKTFTTVALFRYATEAQIIKGRLESDGLDVFLSDHLGTDPLISKAIGGIKLKVRSYEAVAAKKILNSMQQYSVNDEGNAVHCPNCKSMHVELFSTIKDLKSLFRMLSGALFSSVPFYPKHKYRCEMCDMEFDLK